ncbi:hypothetical protein [Streptosporangium sp. NPDC051022]|uniref:hypothetical protein n=1 Tax=Streptosporangium sp. NPDC051022 TaxID=3155752 RepID=UPI003428AB58
MIHLRTVALRTVTVAALGLAMFGVPAAANAAPVNTTPSVVRQDVCSTVRAVAAPFLALVDAHVISLDTALNAIAAITELDLSVVRNCLGV